QSFRITRYRKHRQHSNDVQVERRGKKKGEWSDVSRGTNVESDKMIEEILGMDFQAFCNSVAFGAREDVRSFFGATDTERKKLFETFLGLAAYSEAEVQVKTEMKGLTDKSVFTEHKVATLQRRIDDYNNTLEELSDVDSIEEAKEQVKQGKKQLASLKKKRDTTEKKRKQAATSATRVRALYDEQYDAYDEEYDDHANAKYGVEKRIRAFQETLAGHRANVRTYQKQLGDARALIEAGECPTCKQAVTKKSGGGEMRKLEKALKDFNAKVNTSTMDIEITETELSVLVEPSPPSTKATDRADEKAQELESEVIGIANEMTNLKVRVEANEKVVRQHGNQEKVIREKIEELAEERKDLIESTKDAKKRLQILTFWRDGFGNRGIKSFLMESIIPAINKQATQYAVKLLGAGTKIMLSSTTRLKSKKAEVREKISIEAIIPYCTDTYAGASKGQKKRLDLALLLAFRNVVAQRSGSPFSQLFADEIFDGLDASGVETIGELLQELSEDVPVMLITHDPKLKPAAERTITVSHESGIAEVKTA
ncbi:hypothetical protein DRQ25_16150, partial [Candidatus Fermentibacteria bacterium]